MFELLSRFGWFGRGGRPPLSTPARSILFVTTHCPTRSHAGGLRLLDLCSRIRAIAPQTVIDVFAYRDEAIDGDYADVEALFDHVYYCDRRRMNFNRFLKRRPQRADYDVVSFEYLQQPSAVRSFLRHAGKALFTPMELLTRAHALAPALAVGDARLVKRMRRDQDWEAAVCRIVDEIVCVSQPDAEFARRRQLSAKVSCLETGLSELEFGAEPSKMLGEPFTVVFVAFFGSQTNRDALLWYLDGPHALLRTKFPDYRLDVVGRGDLSSFRARMDEALNLIGEVDRLGPFIARAAVGIAPALSGAGFRGKINQYACFAVPTVASPLAAEGFAYQPGDSILVAETSEAFAEAVATLLVAPTRREVMGEKARKICAEHYAWESRDPEIARLFNLA
jgi:glycosyltransferase involved in cell wall biosynthesis